MTSLIMLRLKPLCVAAAICGSVLQTSHASIRPSDYLAPIWDKMVLYEADDQEAFIQKVKFTGRYQAQYYHLDSNEPLFSAEDQEYANDDVPIKEYEDWVNRRQVLGFSVDFPHHWKFTVKGAVSEDYDPFWAEWFEIILAWHTAYSEFEVGRLDFLFAGMERSYTSIEDDVVERAFLSTQLTPAEAVGMHFHHELSPRMQMHAGIFDGTINDFMSDFDGGIVTVAGLAYEMPTIFAVGHFKLDYLYNDGNEKNNAFSEYRHQVYAYYEGGDIGYRVGAEAVYAHGVGDRADVWGFTVMGTNIVEEHFIFRGTPLYATARFHFAGGENEYAIGNPHRFHHHVPHWDITGEHLYSVYGGLTHRIYQDRLKLMAGVEYTKVYDTPEEDPVDDYDVLGFSLAIRVSW